MHIAEVRGMSLSARIWPRAVEELRPDEVWDKTCFYSSPIRKPGTDVRQHADAFLNALVEPAIEQLDGSMRVVRADHLSSSPVTGSVFEHVVRSGLLIADLSYHNASVLHEVGLRHGSGKPCVLISRLEDEIPANLREVRTVLVKTETFWDFYAEFEVKRREIAEYARWALSADAAASNPVQRLFPDYRKYFR